MKPEQMQSELARHGIHSKPVQHRFYIRSPEVRKKALEAVSQIRGDDDMDVIIKPHVKDKSVAQRGLQWQWYKDVCRSGLGDTDDEQLLHLRSKYQFAVPIMLRIDETFAAIWPELFERFKSDKEKLMYVVDQFVSTERKDFPISEYLENFQRWWLDKGVELTNPDDRGIEWR